MSDERTDIFRGGYTDAEIGAARSLKFGIYKAESHEHFQRTFEKYEATGKVNLRDRGEWQRTDSRLPTPEMLKRDFGGGDYIIEHLDGGKAVEWSFASVERNQPVTISADPPRRARATLRSGRESSPRVRHVRHTRAADSVATLASEMVERSEKQHAAALARIEQHARELRDQAERHQEEVRRLEREKRDADMKRLEEKIAAASHGEEKPTDLTSVLVQLAAAKLSSGDEETAENLIGMARGDDEGAGGFWGFAKSAVSEVVEAVKENPQQALNTLAMFRGGLTQPQPTATAQNNAPQQQQQAQGSMLPPQFVELLDAVAQNCTRDGGEEFFLIEDTASLILRFGEANPEFKPTLADVMNLSAVEIILQIAQLTPHNRFLLQLPHTGAWFTELKAELFSGAGDDPDDPEGEAVIAQDNGAGKLHGAV